MKMLSSDCGSAWLFNVKREEDQLVAGLACFVSNSPEQVIVQWRGERLILGLPHRAVSNPMPCRVLNARLALLN
jgi:hypothetical protein